MSVVRLIVATRNSNILFSGKIIKEILGSVASGTHCTKKKLCTMLVLFTTLYRGAGPTKHTMKYIYRTLGFLCEGNSCFKEVFCI